MNDDDFAELFKKLPSRSGGTSWQDVTAELTALGSTIGDVVRTAWQRSENDAVLGQVRGVLDQLIEDVNHAADGTPETRQARDQLARLAEAIRDAASRAGDEVRPELLELLRRANSELRRVTRVDEQQNE